MAVKAENRTAVVWRVIILLVRLAVGITFVVSGWSKSVDPWGFVYKIDEYLSVWGFEFPRELTLTAAISLSVAEFSVGVLITVGAMRRGAVWLAALFMAFMLPLTIYIYVADPVSDCGCFGDFFVLSNMVTLLKNIALTAMIIVLLKYNTRVGGLYEPGIQWLVIACSVAFSFMLSFIGYRVQPLVDFRPYPTGSYIYDEEGDNPERTLAVYDDNEDVSEDVLGADGDMLLLSVPNTGIHFLTRARFANDLADAVKGRGGRMAAVVAAEGDMLDSWKQLALPSYELYSGEDTSLKELVRGDAGLLYVRDGRIIWKRNLSSVHYDELKDTEAIEKFFSSDMAVDDGKMNIILSVLFFICMLLVYTLNFPNRILDRYFERRSQKKS